MRSAPPVLVPVGRFVWGPRLALALAVLSALGLWWAYRSTTPALHTGMWAVVWLFAGFVSWRQLGRELLSCGQLAWDGEAWSFVEQNGGSGPVRVSVLWDTGSAMLVGLYALPDARRSSPGLRCVWLRASQAPALWHGLRCALYGRDIL